MLVKLNDWPSFFTSSLYQWLFKNLTGGDVSASFDWPQIFGSALHFLWRIRNEEIFEKLTPSPSEIYNCFCVVFSSNLVERDLIDVHLTRP